MMGEVKSNTCKYEETMRPTTKHGTRSEGVLGESGQWHATFEDARAANTHEHSLTVRSALKAYPWAVAWSLLISLSIIMEGYDTALINSLYAYPTYARRFGTIDSATGTYQISAGWQSAMSSGSQVGAIVGALANGFIIGHFGYRTAFMLGIVLMALFVFISFFGMTVGLQTAGQVLCGVPWGIFATIGPAYASELCPLPLRAYLTAYTNLCFASGQFIAAGVLQSLIKRGDDWAWRMTFGLQWVWIPTLGIAALFMPESPWYLVRKGRYADAEKSVLRLMTSVSQGTSYLNCFQGIDLRRTEIAIVTFLGQITCGAQFAYSATYFFQQTGLSSEQSYKLNLGGTAIAFIGTLMSWSLMCRIGRRTLYVSGMSGMALWLFIIGVLAIPTSNSKVKWVQSALCLVWLFTFSLTVGPIGWTIPAEVSSTRLRSKTIVLARNAYYAAQIIANVIQPYMMNPSAWNWKGKTGFFWFVFALMSVMWAFFRLPETKDRSYEELDLMFMADVPTRQFKKYQVDAFQMDKNYARKTNGRGNL